MNEKSSYYLEPDLIKNIQSLLIKWWHRSKERKKERNFFWRKWILNPKELIVELNGDLFPRDFGIFCVETVLRLTKAKNINGYFKPFFKRFHSFKDIKSVDETELMKELTRVKTGRFLQNARDLKYRAAIIVDKFDSKVPISKVAIRSLMKTAKRPRHIYLVEALSLYVHGIFGAPVDVNVERIYVNFFNLYREKKEIQDDSEFCDFAEKLVPREDPKIFNLALLDLGALVCKKRNPKCNECSLKPICKYEKKD